VEVLVKEEIKEIKDGMDLPDIQENFEDLRVIKDLKVL
jgi:hypothetical protein